MTDYVPVVGTQRQRLLRMLNVVSRLPKEEEVVELDQLIHRACPDRPANANSFSRFIGMMAATLTQSSLSTLRSDTLVFNKVNGIAAIGVMFNPANRTKASANTSASNTLLLVRRNGIIVVDDVPLPMRTGSVLMDGEICIRRLQITASEKAKLAATTCVIGMEYLDRSDGDPRFDKEYQLCFAVHDLILANNTASNARARPSEDARLLPPFERLTRLMGITQCPPVCDERCEEAITMVAKEFKEENKQPKITIFCKQPFLAGERLWLKTIPNSLIGVELDGVVFLPSQGPYLVAQANPELLKYKAWKDNTGDFVFVRGDDDVYRFFVINSANQARCISEKIWYGDTEEERRSTRSALDMEASRLAAGGDPSTPHIFECQPSLGDNANEFFALATQPFPTPQARLHAAGKLLRWRPTGDAREDKLLPNSELNFWAIVEALLFRVTVEDIAKQIDKNKKRLL